MKPGNSEWSEHRIPEGNGLSDSDIVTSLIEPALESTRISKGTSNLASLATIEESAGKRSTGSDKPHSSSTVYGAHRDSHGESKTFDLISSLWHSKVQMMQVEMEQYKDETKSKDGYITMLEEENRKLKVKLTEQQRVMSDLSVVHNEQVISKARELLSPKFSNNQINLMMGLRARVNWTSDELAQGLSLRYFGVQGHNFVTKTLQYPLPKLSCLQKYVSRMDMRQGFLEEVLTMLKVKSSNMSERVCVLLYDEMSCSEILEYDRKHDDVLGPHTKVQV